MARCFRYDQVDATHATDFFQIEGIVLGDDINFRTLLGLLTIFAKEMAQAEESKFFRPISFHGTVRGTARPSPETRMDGIGGRRPVSA